VTEYEKFDAIVVGAGPGGSAAALELARHEKQVLLLERGKVPGAKSATGGILYGQTNTPFNLDYLIPDFEERAPIERPIHKYYMHHLSGNKFKTTDLSRLHAYKTRWSYTILRGKFDPWFADQAAVEARRHGGGLLTEVTVTGPLVENGHITGVVTEELDPIRADVVVAADGSTSNLARKAGLRPWMKPEDWFQGVKVVAEVGKSVIEETFGAREHGGTAHLYAGDLFGGARGGGFLYTNRDTLSIGTVFHLDSIAAKRVPPHEYLDRLLNHPLVANAVGETYREVEYSAKLIPDGKRWAMQNPHKDNLLVVGDAAGHLKAAGPIIKGLNLAMEGGVLAAQAYLLASSQGRLERVGGLYSSFLAGSLVHRELWTASSRVLRTLVGYRWANRMLERMVNGGGLIRTRWGQKRIVKALNNYRLAGATPDTEFVYAGLPTAIGRELGEALPAVKVKPKLRTLDDRIGALAYDTDIGREHIKVLDASPHVSGLAVTTCPVSSPASSRGCYRFEDVVLPNGQKQTQVVLDTQPCVECGTCALMARTDWNHPRGGKGVQYAWG
jgi:electron transfer flavoprotein-quinone oxidoreductase